MRTARYRLACLDESCFLTLRRTFGRASGRAIQAMLLRERPPNLDVLYARAQFAAISETTKEEMAQLQRKSLVFEPLTF